MAPATAGPVLKTKRLLLRPLRLDDAPRIAELIGAWEVIRWLAMPPYPYHLSDAESFVAETQERGSRWNSADFAVDVDGAIAGTVGYAPRHQGISFGYWLGQPYWGQGYMTEAVAAALAHFFASPNADELASGILEGNPASLHIQEKFGFEVVGRSEIFSVPNGKALLHIDTRLTRQSYEALKA